MFIRERCRTCGGVFTPGYDGAERGSPKEGYCEKHDGGQTRRYRLIAWAILLGIVGTILWALRSAS